jgi:hypothetical protein
VARPAPRTLASSHLLTALNALDDACNPEAVLSPRRIWPLHRDDPPEAFATLADITQREFCCTSALFTAFAAEAYVNDFLDVHLRHTVSDARFAKIDRWSTRHKYLDGVKRAYGRLFWEGDEVMPAIEELFDLRNRLAHARPGVGPAMAGTRDPDWRREYPPSRVARWLVAVAGAADSLEMRCYGFDYFSFPATLIWRGRQIVQARAAGAEPLPAAPAAGQPPLIEALNADIARRNDELGDLRLTYDELRDARIAHANDVGPWDAFTELVVRQAAAAPDTPRASRDDHGASHVDA